MRKQSENSLYGVAGCCHQSMSCIGCASSGKYSRIHCLLPTNRGTPTYLTIDPQPLPSASVRSNAARSPAPQPELQTRASSGLPYPDSTRAAGCRRRHNTLIATWDAYDPTPRRSLPHLPAMSSHVPARSTSVRASTAPRAATTTPHPPLPS